MSIRIAGKDRTTDIGAEIDRAVSAKITAEPFRFLPWGINALSLSQAPDEETFAARYLELLRYKHRVSPDAFEVPVRSGFRRRVMRRIKTLLWKLLRYQHEHFIFQQNSINLLITNAFEIQNADTQRKLDAMQKQLDELRQAAAPTQGSGANE